MSQSNKFLSHYGIKGMRWDKQKLEISENRINNITKSKESNIKFDPSQPLSIQLIKAAKDIQQDKTQYSSNELIRDLISAEEKSIENPSLENIFNSGVAENRLKTKYPEQFEKYKKERSEKLIRKLLIDIMKKENK